MEQEAMERTEKYHDVEARAKEHGSLQRKRRGNRHSVHCPLAHAFERGGRKGAIEKAVNASYLGVSAVRARHSSSRSAISSKSHPNSSVFSVASCSILPRCPFSMFHDSNLKFDMRNFFLMSGNSDRG